MLDKSTIAQIEYYLECEDWFSEALDQSVPPPSEALDQSVPPPSHEFRERCRAAAASARAELLRRSKETEPSAAASEEDLVALAKNGNVKAFGELIGRHREACLERAMVMLRNRMDAEDEVQNAFLKAFQRLDQYRGEGTFAAWLNRIVENQCLMLIRTRSAYMHLRSN